VTIMYGPHGMELAKKVSFQPLPCQMTLKLTASQFEGLKAEKLPDNLEQLARFEKDKMGISIVSCGTFHVLDGFAKEIVDKTNIEDFIEPIDLHESCRLMLEADKILYY